MFCNNGSSAASMSSSTNDDGTANDDDENVSDDADADDNGVNRPHHHHQQQQQQDTEHQHHHHRRHRLKVISERILFGPTQERTARELQQLPTSEREQVWADMIGYKDAMVYRMSIAETPDFVQYHLGLMDRELAHLVLMTNTNTYYGSKEAAGGTAISGAAAASSSGHEQQQQHPSQYHHETDTNSSSTPSSHDDQHQQHHHHHTIFHPHQYDAFRIACSQDSTYVQSLRIMFLRADNFNAKLAAKRMVTYFQYKQELFGNASLGRDIRLQHDMSIEDIESLQAGGIQLLPKTDHAGRGILLTRQLNYRYNEHKNLLRAFFYVGSIALQEEQYQKLGFVSVSYQVGVQYPSSTTTNATTTTTTNTATAGTATTTATCGGGGYDYELTRKVGMLVKSMPIRFVAIYICYSTSPWKQVADLISHIVSPLLRVRLRSIQGSHQECLYQLLSLGIPVSTDCFPVNDDGRSNLDNHIRWIQMRQRLENEEEEGKGRGG